MKLYIDKALVVAEIEKRIKINKECMLGLRNLDYYQGKVDALNDTLSFIDTLEVKEVDLDTDFGVCWGEYCDCGGNINDYKVAKHFFELGLKAKEK
jgi:hypothetical protein